MPDPAGQSADPLREAVRLYLARAYPDGSLPLPVAKRIGWRDEITFAELIAGPPFERVRGGGDTPEAHCLRLGNAAYPHMKLQINLWPVPPGFLLSVNTHDTMLEVPGAADVEKFRLLREENARLKAEIEADWRAAGLPTFAAFIDNYLHDREKTKEEATD